MAKGEQYTSGSGKVESYKKDKTRDHDEIVLRLKDGRRVVISNNTKVGVRIEPREGDEVNYHGYGVQGTNVVHKVHPNQRSRGGWLEHVKKAASNKDFDDIVKAYKDRYGVDLSHMAMRWSKHPVYNNGERSYEFDDDETGGSWVNDSTIRINPNIGPVMKRFGVEGVTQREFRKRLIAHELAHEIWKKQREERKDLIKSILAKAKEEKFTTPYLPTVPKQKLDEETFAEYMSDQLNKKAASYSLKDNPTFEDALKVFDKLDFDDRANLVPRHPDFLRKVPDDMLFDRQVVVDGKGDPVGFQEFYSRKDKMGRKLPPHNVIAVAPEARGNGLSRLMVDAAISKARKEKVKRLLWEAFADNDPSIRAALSAGFEDATPKGAKGYRKFVYNVVEKKD